MLLPPPLKKGETMGFFSPSSPATVFAPQRFERAMGYAKAQGFDLKAGALTGQSDHYRSASIKARAEELNQLIRDPNVRCIMSTIGGMNSNALLPYIDYAALVDDPKIIVGYSDLTALLLGIYAKTGLITFYGPALVASLGEFPPLVDETFDAFRAVTTENVTLPMTYKMPAQWTDVMIDWGEQTEAKLTYENAWQFMGKGQVNGRIIGGNLNTLSGIWGTPYMPAIETGDILLIEDSLLDIATVERSLAHLKLAGVFDMVGAVLLGKHELFDDKGTGRSTYNVLEEILDGKPLAVVDGFDSCHTHPMLTIPLGAQACIDFDAQTVSLTQPWLAGEHAGQ
ncbi:LD-carboxypeptidase [Salinivibrio sp. AR647]|uniref:S66 family peptidase n=1 Tax=Salinivibrio sp. AR647 TaxID=1909438 RepID=UPI0009863459|nr:S66 peptidase family protein [Salinivibrio sp. AR647]OOE91971.1 LD-carboxypeptidase [Salinivibrio sp. AR647]